MSLPLLVSLPPPHNIARINACSWVPLVCVNRLQELELLLCGIPEIDVAEWKRCSRYLGAYRRAGENHAVIKVR